MPTFQPVKLPTDLLAAADALVPDLGAHPTLTGYARVTRAMVIRLALSRGLDALRAEIAAARAAAAAR